MLEVLALLQCLQGDDARARKWRNARTVKERREFEFAELKKCSEAARDLEPLWNGVNEYVHSNSTAPPAHSLRRSVFGYDIVVGPFYDAVPLAAMMGIVNGIEFLVLEWLNENLVPSGNAKLSRHVRNVGARVRSGADKMKTEAAATRTRTSDGIPVSDQRRAVAHLTRRARRAGRSDFARWVLARAKRSK